MGAASEYRQRRYRFQFCRVHDGSETPAGWRSEIEVELQRCEFQRRADRRVRLGMTGWAGTVTSKRGHSYDADREAGL